MKAIHPHPEKKLRGVPRRLRALRRWALGLKDAFPTHSSLQSAGKYWNWKLPVLQALVEGKQSTAEVKRQVAQSVVDACAHLIAAKPPWASTFRVTCTIALPDMLSSEICIYMSESYFKSRVESGTNASGVTFQQIEDRSLAEHWQLSLPAGIHELGLLVSFPGYAEGIDRFFGERWWFGEVTANPSVKGTSCAYAQAAPYVER